MKYLIKFVIFFSLILFMSTVSIEAMKASRDQLRIFNARALSKSIQFYYTVNGEYPKSGINNNISELLYNEKLLTNIFRDPAYTSVTLPFNYYYYKSFKTAEHIYSAIINFDLNTYVTNVKNKLYHSLLNANKPEIQSLPQANNQRKQNLDNWENGNSLINNDTLKTKQSQFDNNGIPIECVIAYKSLNTTNSYEISVFLESRFFKEKMKWDGGDDNNRYEIGNDLRLNTKLSTSKDGLEATSEGVSIIK
jgi:hypothetical protein